MGHWKPLKDTRKSFKDPELFQDLFNFFRGQLPKGPLDRSNDHKIVSSIKNHWKSYKDLWSSFKLKKWSSFKQRSMERLPVPGRNLVSVSRIYENISKFHKISSPFKDSQIFLKITGPPLTLIEALSRGHERSLDMFNSFSNYWNLSIDYCNPSETIWVPLKIPGTSSKNLGNLSTTLRNLNAQTSAHTHASLNKSWDHRYKSLSLRSLWVHLYGDMGGHSNTHKQRDRKMDENPICIASFLRLMKFNSSSWMALWVCSHEWINWQDVYKIWVVPRGQAAHSNNPHAGVQLTRLWHTAGKTFWKTFWSHCTLRISIILIYPQFLWNDVFVEFPVYLDLWNYHNELHFKCVPAWQSTGRSGQTFAMMRVCHKTSMNKNLLLT